MKVKVYNCMVRPGGWVMHEVPKFELTAAEINVIRYKHMAYDAVPPQTIEACGEKEINDKVLRKDLTRRYGDKAVEAAIGRFGPLPKTVEDLPEDPFQIDDPREDEPVEKKTAA